MQQEVHRFFTGFIGHQLSALAEVAGRSEAILATQIAVVGDIQTHCLNGRSHSEVGILFIIVRRKENAFLICLQNFRIAGTDFFRIVKPRQLCHDFLRTFRSKRRCNIIQHVIGQLVHHMHAAAVHVQHNVIVAQFILMNHNSVSSFRLPWGTCSTIKIRV